MTSVSRVVHHVNSGIWRDLADPVTANGSVDMIRAEENTSLLCEHGNGSCGSTTGSVNTVMDLVDPQQDL